MRRFWQGTFKNKICKQKNPSCLGYEKAQEEGYLLDFVKNIAFTATTVEGNVPARQQGMDGEYIILEFADWNQDSTTSLFDKNKEMKGKPKDIVVMKGEVVSKYHFDNII